MNKFTSLRIRSAIPVADKSGLFCLEKTYFDRPKIGEASKGTEGSSRCPGCNVELAFFFFFSSFFSFFFRGGAVGR